MSFPTIATNPIIAPSNPREDTLSVTPRSADLISHILPSMEKAIQSSTPREKTIDSEGEKKTAAERAIDLLAPTTRRFLEAQGPIRYSPQERRQPPVFSLNNLQITYLRAIHAAYIKSNENYMLSNYHLREIKKAKKERNLVLFSFHHEKYSKAIASYSYFTRRYQQLFQFAVCKGLIKPEVQPNQDLEAAATCHNYKTRLCKYHARGKTCRKARNCSFAHGEHELRELRVEKIAAICVNFLNNNCMYGINCYYCHSQNELEAVIKKRLKERDIQFRS